MTKDNKNKTKVPNLRFPGFEEEWERKKLQEVTTYVDYRGKAPIKTDEGIFLVTAKNIKKGFIDYENSKEYVSEKDYLTVMSKGLPEIGDILFTTEAPMGNVAQVDDKNIALAQRVIKFSGGYNLENSYLLYYMLSDIFQKIISEKAIGTTVQGISGKELHQIDISFPQISEQIKIASFLSLIDNRIQTQSKIIEEMKSLKGALSRKIFSQELRFKDENGNDFLEWKEKKLGEIGNFQTSSIDKLLKENEKEVFLINYMNVYRHENINNKAIKNYQIVTAKDSQIESCNLKRGDILFTPSSETPDDIGHSVVIFEDLHNAVYSYHLMRFRPKIKMDILYSHYFCNVPSVLNQLSKLATGSTRFTISVSSFSSINVSLPSLKEQTCIANFLSSIDEKIETEKKILEQHKNQKTYLLQNMFI